MTFRRAFAGLIVACFSAVTDAQITSAEITGTITDSAGAVVAGATVTATNPATNTQRTATTSGAGVFNLTALPPGVYSVRVERQGFSSQVRTGLELQVAQVARLDLTLQVGSVSEVIEVQGGAPLIETDNTSLGTVIENQRILDLPLNGRNYLQLAALTPGATTAAPASFVMGLRQGGTRSLFTLTVSGQRILFNRYLLDGLENTSPNWQSYIFLPSLDALQEFKVESGITPAEYGKNATQINVTTKSGTNDFHGTAWEFLRNSFFDARNYFNPRGTAQPPFKRNQFGFTFGGPVLIPKVINGRNRLFFMVNYEGLRERKALVQPATVPPSAWIEGDFSAVTTPIYDYRTRLLNSAGNAIVSSTPFPGNRIPANLLQQISQRYMRDWMPRVSATTAAANNFVNTEGRPTDNDQQNARFDWVQTNSSSMFFRYSHSGEIQYNPTPIPQHGTNVTVQAHQGLLAHTMVIGANKVNEFRAGVSRFENANVPPQAGIRNVVQELGIPLDSSIPLYWGVPNVTFGGGFTLAGNSADSPFINFDTLIQANNNFAWTTGKHSMKFGGEITRTRFNQLGGVTTRGRFSVNGQYSSAGPAGSPIVSAHNIADWMQGAFSVSESQSGVPLANYRNWYFAFYFQDNWKVTRKLNVNIGLRWEDYTPWIDKFDHISNFEMKWDNSVFPTLVRAGKGDPYEGGPYCCNPPSSLPFVRDGRRGRGIQKNRLDSWAPRLGITYLLSPSTVLRTGAGIYYVQEIQNKNFEVVRHPPFTVRRNETANNLIPNLTWQKLSVIESNIPSLFFGHEYDVSRPRVAQWSFGIQQQLSGHISLEANYLGASGQYLEGAGTFNIARPGPGAINPRRPFPIFGGTGAWIEGAYHSTYHALQAKFQHRPKYGFNLLTAFTWGKSIDDLSAYRIQFGDSGIADMYNKRDSRGLSAFDFRTNLTNSLLYQLPFGRGAKYLPNVSRAANTLVGGWQLGTIVTLVSGFPLSAVCGSAAVQNGDGACRPDNFGRNANLARGQQDPSRWFDTTAFINRHPGAEFRFGHTGRNTLIGPGVINWDFSLLKDIRFNERHGLELRWEVFNLANHPLFDIPGGTVGAPNFGVVSATKIDNRQMQVALRYAF
jgi:hypothetical protein